MGMFDLISNAFKGGGNRQKIVQIDSTLGNVLMTGYSPKGMEMIMSNYAIDSLNKGGGVIVFRNARNGFSAYPSITVSARSICEISTEEGAVTESFDPFSSLSDAEYNKYIINLFDKYNEIDKNKKMSYQSYIALVRSLLKRSGKNIKLNEYGNYPIETIENINLTLNMPEAERNRNEYFLNSIRPDIRELESYFYDFTINCAGEILSGTKPLEKLFSTKDIVEVNLDFDSKPKESEVVMSTMIDTICKLNYASAGKSFVSVIVNEIPNEVLISSGLNKLIKSNHCKVAYTVTDISNLIEKSNEWIEYADSYFFFKQNSNNNKEFCSAFFGTYERVKESTTSGVSNPILFDRLLGRGASTKNKSVTYTTEKERIYLPDVFANLMENEAVYFFKGTNEHSRLTVF